MVTDYYRCMVSISGSGLLCIFTVKIECNKLLLYVSTLYFAFLSVIRVIFTSKTSKYNEMSSHSLHFEVNSEQISKPLKHSSSRCETLN